MDRDPELSVCALSIVASAPEGTPVEGTEFASGMVNCLLGCEAVHPKPAQAGARDELLKPRLSRPLVAVGTFFEHF